MNLNRRLILASNSPRRKELLASLGYTFEVKVKEVHEDFPAHLTRADVAEYLASHKANAYKEDLTDEILITADTIVCLDEHILNKPADITEGRKMLRSLSGRHHEVITGVCLLSAHKKLVFHDETKVFFKELLEEEIEYYLTTYKPYDKAGGYG